MDLDDAEYIKDEVASISHSKRANRFFSQARLCLFAKLVSG
jgi:hypothetical protein